MLCEKIEVPFILSERPHDDQFAGRGLSTVRRTGVFPPILPRIPPSTRFLRSRIGDGMLLGFEVSLGQTNVTMSPEGDQPKLHDPESENGPRNRASPKYLQVLL